jgi:predicted lipid-binding transport protein (Tim44 family)
MSRSRHVLVPLAAAGLAVLWATDAYARAGGGSGNYGGGRGRGGNSFFFLYYIFSHPILLLMILIGIGGFMFVSRTQSVRYQGRRRERVRQVELAAAEAAEDDPAFEPERVSEQAHRLFADVQTAWDRCDRARLADLVGRDLLVEWNRRLDDFDRRGWHNRVEVLAGPRIEYVGLVNREADRDDRAVVRVEAQLLDIVEDSRGWRIMRSDAESSTRAVAEYWTLGKREGDGSWMLLSIEQRAEGDHHLAGPLVPTPWADTAALREQALVEGAVADGLDPEMKVAEVVSIGYEGDAHAQALDLSLVDGRFAPSVLEVAVQRALAAWAEAIDGSDRRLAELATPEARREMLHPGYAGDAARVVIRAPRVRAVTIEGLDAHAEPPRLTVAVQVDAVRYVEDRDTTILLSGSQSRPTRFTERWTFGLDGPDANPWRIVDAAAMAAPASQA